MQWLKGMGGNASEERACLRRVEDPGQRRRGQHRRRPESGQPQRVPRHPEQRAHDVLGQLVEPARRSTEQQLPPRPVDPEPVGRGLDRSVERPGGAVVERVDAIDLGPSPLQAIAVQPEVLDEPGPGRHHVDGGAIVEHQTREDVLAGANAAADPVGGLQHRDVDPLGGQGDGGGEPVGPGADHNRGTHCWRTPARCQVTLSGIGPLGSHGCSSTRSFTFQVPRSITPRAASITLYS